MVRGVAERVFPSARHLLEEFGDMMILTGKTIWSALRPPYPYGGELVSQFLFTLQLVWLPLLISTVAICLGGWTNFMMRLWKYQSRPMTSA